MLYKLFLSGACSVVVISVPGENFNKSLSELHGVEGIKKGVEHRVDITKPESKEIQMRVNVVRFDEGFSCEYYKIRDPTDSKSCNHRSQGNGGFVVTRQPRMRI